jgi:2-hydroxy-3-oxopropionate reductase
MHKDLTFVLESAAAAAVATPMAAAGVQLYAALLRQGLGDQDLAAVRQTICNLSGTSRCSTAGNTTVTPAANTH